MHCTSTVRSSIELVGRAHGMGMQQNLQVTSELNLKRNLATSPMCWGWLAIAGAHGLSCDGVTCAAEASLTQPTICRMEQAWETC